MHVIYFLKSICMKKNLYLYLETVPKNKPKFRRRNMDEPKLEVGNITRCK